MSKMVIEPSTINKILYEFDREEEMGEFMPYLPKLSKHFRRLGLQNFGDSRIPFFWYPAITRFLIRLIQIDPCIKVIKLIEKDNLLDVDLAFETAGHYEKVKLDISEILFQVHSEIDSANHKKAEKWLEENARKQNAS